MSTAPKRVQRGLAVIALALLGCGQTLYYATMEQLGRQKRDILAERVRDAKDDQRDAEEQFLSTYEVFKQVADVDGGELEDFYDRLSSEYEKSESRAEQVRKRITSIEQVAGDLFEEWEDEIGQISSRDLRRRSEAKLRDTRERYAVLMRAMRQAESRMEPVLVAFRDQVLFLKHNLNAYAIGELQTTTTGLQGDVDRLIRDMQRSVRESEAFLAAMDG